MTGVNVQARRRPIFDKAEDLDKSMQDNEDMCSKAGEKCKSNEPMQVLKLIKNGLKHGLEACK